MTSIDPFIIVALLFGGFGLMVYRLTKRIDATPIAAINAETDEISAHIDEIPCSVDPYDDLLSKMKARGCRVSLRHYKGPWRQECGDPDFTPYLGTVEPMLCTDCGGRFPPLRPSQSYSYGQRAVIHKQWGVP